jgi:hypothetical protein
MRKTANTNSESSMEWLAIVYPSGREERCARSCREGSIAIG